MLTIDVPAFFLMLKRTIQKTIKNNCSRFLLDIFMKFKPIFFYCQLAKIFYSE